MMTIGNVMVSEAIDKRLESLGGFFFFLDGERREIERGKYKQDRNVRTWGEAAVDQDFAYLFGYLARYRIFNIVMG